MINKGQIGKILNNEKDLIAMLEYLDDATDNDRIEIARYALGLKGFKIKEDDDALSIYEDAIKPYLKQNLETELRIMKAC